MGEERNKWARTAEGLRYILENQRALSVLVYGPVEYFISNGHGKTDIRSHRECSKKSSSKATAILTRGAYTSYVSTAKWRERRWRLFSTFPLE